MSLVDKTYIGVANLHANLSKATNLKVGCCFVTKNGVIVGGVNGLPTLLGNECEENGITKPETIHAELNGILKAAKEGISLVGSTLYLTHSPCRACASMLLQVGIKRVVYNQEYRDTTGVGMLKNSGVDIRKYLDRISFND